MWWGGGGGKDVGEQGLCQEEGPVGVYCEGPLECGEVGGVEGVGGRRCHDACLGQYVGGIAGEVGRRTGYIE